MKPADDLLRSGDYARKQIYSRSRLVRWSHGSRFEVARALVAPQAGGRLLDYGCGDGTFVAMVHADFAEAVGVDVDPAQVEETARRLGRLPGVRFGLTPAAARAAQTGSTASPAEGAWDVVTCMEVLEHCLEDERRRVIGELRRLVAADGRVVVSVPIEIGPALAGKQLARAAAALRGLGDYRHRERYSPVEFARALVGLGVARPVLEGHGFGGLYRYHGHKGFDYRVVAGELAERFSIVRRVYSPMRALGAFLNSQAWFMCVPR
ncbi:MAG TPA: class I SAM-dependent methyltransferase [Vicinamibacterales bacterium]